MPGAAEAWGEENFVLRGNALDEYSMIRET